MSTTPPTPLRRPQAEPAPPVVAVPNPSSTVAMAGSCWLGLVGWTAAGDPVGVHPDSGRLVAVEEWYAERVAAGRGGEGALTFVPVEWVRA